MDESELVAALRAAISGDRDNTLFAEAEWIPEEGGQVDMRAPHPIQGGEHVYVAAKRAGHGVEVAFKAERNAAWVALDPDRPFANLAIMRRELVAPTLVAFNIYAAEAEDAP